MYERTLGEESGLPTSFYMPAQTHYFFLKEKPGLRRPLESNMPVRTLQREPGGQARIQDVILKGAGGKGEAMGGGEERAVRRGVLSAGLSVHRACLCAGNPANRPLSNPPPITAELPFRLAVAGGTSYVRWLVCEQASW